MFCERRFFFLRHFFVVFIFSVFFNQAILAQTSPPKDDEKKNPPLPASTVKGKAPIIVIPGLIGSELINKTNNETVWFNLTRAKDDDLRLPISPNLAANQDNLVAGDILRNIKYLKFLPETEIYEKLVGSLVIPGGYEEGKWEAPSANGYQDTYYVFPYDWRRDNVENARLLIRKIAALKTSLNRPDLKFNIVAHSMGGLIARYAAKYGDADIPAGNAPFRPTWAGAKHIGKIFLVGTPNEGSLSALDSLLNGFAPLNAKGINIPFVQSVTKFDLFTIPSIYQLLPHSGTAKIYGDNLQPIKINLYDPLVWERYGWAVYDDPKFAKEFTPAEQANARAYFRAVLSRAKRFQDAIDTQITAKTPVSMYIIGADCKPTLDGMILYRDTKKNKWETIFSPESFKQSDGTKITSKEVKKLLYSSGDGVVTTRSLLTSSFPGARVRKNYRTALFIDDVAFTCEAHNQLTGNAEVQSKMFNALYKDVKDIGNAVPSVVTNVSNKTTKTVKRIFTGKSRPKKRGN